MAWHIATKILLMAFYHDKAQLWPQGNIICLNIIIDMLTMHALTKNQVFQDGQLIQKAPPSFKLDSLGTS